MIKIKSVVTISSLILLLLSCTSTLVHSQEHSDKQYFGYVADQDILALGQIIEKTKEEYINVIENPKLEIACITKINPQHSSYTEFLSASVDYKHPRIKRDPSSKFSLAVAAYISSKASSKDEAKDFFNICLKSIAASLDSKSDFFTEGDSEYLKKLPKKLGIIGIEFVTQDDPDKNTVIRAFKNGPAYAVGIRAGDIITSIDGVTIKDLRGQDSIAMLRGEVDTYVSLEVQRSLNESPIKFDIQRKSISSPSIESKLLVPDYGYIQIYSLGSSVSKGLAKELLTLYTENKNDLRGLILDLRFCTGGLLNQANGVVAPFLPERSLVTEIKGRTNDANFKLTTHPDDHFKSGVVDPTSYTKTYLPAYKDVPIVILINKETASGAEIIAVAMQEYKRAIIMGQNSSGESTLQTIFPMHSGEALKITTAIWLSPLGKSIQDIGISPDIVTEKIKLSEFATEDDATIKRALTFLMKN